MTKLTTHVLDTIAGIPAAGLKIDLYRVEDGQAKLLITSTTNADGRVDSPLLEKRNFKLGTYRLDFHAGKYLKSSADFFDLIPIQFIISDLKRHYHVPLLLSAYGYSTYRGS